MTIAIATTPSRFQLWADRTRLLLAAAIVWAALQVAVAWNFMPAGLNRPLTFAAAHHPFLAAIALIVVVQVAGTLASVVAGPPRAPRALAAVALALAAWPIGRGTMTEWLIMAVPVIGPPTGSPYWPLVGEYILYFVLLGEVAAVVALLTTSTAPPGSSLAVRLAHGLGVPSERPALNKGLAAFAVATLVIGVLMLIFTGPVVAGETRRGQVYFAAAASSALGVYAGVRLLHVREWIWYCPAPLVAGLIGMLVAAIRPALLLPAGYSELNSIPAWGLARALPVELTGVGVLAVLWMLRSRSEPGATRVPRAEPA